MADSTFNPDAADWSKVFATPSLPKLTTYGGSNPTSSPPVTGGAQSNDPLQGWADISSVLGSASSGAKADRALQGQFTQNYDRLMLEAQQDQRASETDALKKLAQTNYIGQGGSHFHLPDLSLNGKSYQLSDYGMGPIAPSEVQKAGAHSLEGQLTGRLAPGGTYQPQPLDSYAKPGTLENIGSYGAMGAGLLGGLLHTTAGDYLKKLLHIGGGSSPAAAAPGALAGGANNFSNALSGTEQAASSGAFNPTALAGGGGAAAAPSALSGLSGDAIGSALTSGAAESSFGAVAPLLSHVPGSVATNAYNAGLFTGPSGVATPAAGNLASGGAGSVMNTLMGKAIPAAGAAYSAYQLAKNKSKSSDIMSGAGTGAGIGTMIMPGVGTAVGAGIGALGGLARHAFGGADQVEQAARKNAGVGIEQLTAGATDAERQEAANAGWKDPNQALALISIRDRLQAEGKDPNQAGALMQQLLDATSHNKNPQAVAAALHNIQGAIG